MRGGWRAWAELLRAPLLLSPIADVLAGWTVGMLYAVRRTAGSPLASDADVWRTARDSLPALALAALTGVFLLAAGMAQNAVADSVDDALRKPSRPLPRGAIGIRAARAAMWALTAAAVACAVLTGVRSLVLCVAVIALTATYHLALKRFRLPGCLALGSLRGFDMLLGTAAVATASASWLPAFDTPPLGLVSPAQPLVIAGLYALFVTGAALHASTDDSPPNASTRRWSRAGLALHAIVLLVLPWKFSPVDAGDATAVTDHAALQASSLLLPVVTLWALGRLLIGFRTLPPGPLTGVALSGLYLFGAIVCLRYDAAGIGLAAAALVLLLFGASRRMRRAFPPS